MKKNKLFLYSLGSLAVLSATAASAEEIATAPSLEGGWSAMIGTMYMVPSVDDQNYFTNRVLFGENRTGPGTTADAGLNSNNLNFDGEYEFGIQAAIGYVFDETANGIELSYRNYDSSTSGSIGEFEQDFNFGPTLPISGFIASEGFDTNQDNRFENFDLMVSQFLDVGTQVQMRFMGGLSYLSELDQTTTANGDLFTGLAVDSILLVDLQNDITAESTSSYNGLGPRVGMDARYDFGPGFGIVGGASFAYFMGDLDTNNTVNVITEGNICTGRRGGCIGFIAPLTAEGSDSRENHAVTNLRANLGIDYVVFFDEQDLPTLGLELGYEVDSYLNGISTLSSTAGEINVTDATFSGPYLNLKGVF